MIVNFDQVPSPAPTIFLANRARVFLFEPPGDWQTACVRVGKRAGLEVRSIRIHWQTP